MKPFSQLILALLETTVYHQFLMISWPNLVLSTVNRPYHVSFDVIVTSIFCLTRQNNVQGEFLFLQPNRQVIISYHLHTSNESEPFKCLFGHLLTLVLLHTLRHGPFIKLLLSSPVLMPRNVSVRWQQQTMSVFILLNYFRTPLTLLSFSQC